MTEYVTNPETNRAVKVNSRLYKQLLRRGLITVESTRHPDVATTSVESTRHPDVETTSVETASVESTRPDVESTRPNDVETTSVETASVESTRPDTVESTRPDVESTRPDDVYSTTIPSIQPTNVVYSTSSDTQLSNSELKFIKQFIINSKTKNNKVSVKKQSSKTKPIFVLKEETSDDSDGDFADYYLSDSD